jgi:hypothetical protein
MFLAMLQRFSYLVFSEVRLLIKIYQWPLRQTGGTDIELCIYILA